MPAVSGIVLYQWGPIAMEVYPLNVGNVEHTTGTDWARKEIAGAAVYREWVGEQDEEIHMRGKVFPHFYSNVQAPVRMAGGAQVQSDVRTLRGSGGMTHLDILDNMRRLGQAQILMRGDGWKLGWFVIDRFSRGHDYLGVDGIGQQVAFEAVFQRVPVPDPTGYFPELWSVLGSAA